MILPLSRLSPIETERLYLRPLGLEDAEAFRATADDPAVAQAVAFLPTPFTLADAQKLIAGNGDGRDCFWGIWQREEAVLIGTVGTHLRGEDEIEIGYWLVSSAHGRGFGTEAADSIVRRLKATFPERRIVAECRPQNKASWHLLEKIGFQPGGQEGRLPGRMRLTFSRS